MSLLNRERCSCGHDGDRHAFRLTTVGTTVLLLPGLGTCCIPGCRCERFRFQSWTVPAPKRLRRGNKKPSWLASFAAHVPAHKSCSDRHGMHNPPESLCKNQRVAKRSNRVRATPEGQ
jgi:hypothetical protein